MVVVGALILWLVGREAASTTREVGEVRLPHVVSEAMGVGDRWPHLRCLVTVEEEERDRDLAAAAGHFSVP